MSARSLEVFLALCSPVFLRSPPDLFRGLLFYLSALSRGSANAGPSKNMRRSLGNGWELVEMALARRGRARIEMLSSASFFSKAAIAAAVLFSLPPLLQPSSAALFQHHPPPTYL